MADENVNYCLIFGRLCFSRRIVMGFVSLAGAALGVGVTNVFRYPGPLTLKHEVMLHVPAAILKVTFSVVAAPFILSNVVIGISRVNMRPSGKINLRAMTYFVLTTILSVVLGMLVVCMIQPGAGVEVAEDDYDEDNDVFSTTYSILDLLRNTFPSDILHLSSEKYKTMRVLVRPETDNHSSILEDAIQVRVEGKFVKNTNIMGLVSVSFIAGMALRSVGEEGEAFLNQTTFLNKILKFVLKLLMCLFPVGEACLIANFIHEVGFSWELLMSLGKFTAAVLGGLVIHGAVVLPLIYLVCTRQNPLPVIRGASSAFLRVLLVPYSDVVSRVHFCCEEVIMIDTRITNFMLHFGLDFNMNGTAFYEMAVAVYVIQLNGLPLDWAILFTLGVAIVLSAVGEAGVPATGTVTTLFILSAAGVSVRNVALPLAVDWLLYFCSPVVNILGNCFGAALVAHLSKADLENMDKQE